MPGKGCRKGHRKHTPIVSRKQQKFFGAEYGRAKRGVGRKTKMSKKVLKTHLKESKGKFRKKKRRR